MTQFPGAFFQGPDAFQPRELEEQEHAEHVHGEGCGHEAVPHEDHIDYVHDGHRHFLKDGKWFHHHRIEDEAGEDDEA
jgi:hypothetical protein